MTAIFPLVWHSLRLGLNTWPTERAGLAALRETLSPSGLSKQHVHSIHRFLECSKILSLPAWTARPTIALYAPLSQVNGQARCASSRSSKALEPFRQKTARNKNSISRAEINAIFGLNFSRKDGNDLLERLQEQRHRGTLDQKLPYPDTLIEKGLAYLRARYPLDEDAAIIARIDREANGEFRLPQTNIDKSPHAVSQFEEWVRERRQSREENEKIETSKAKNEGKELLEKGKRITVRDGTSLVQLRHEPEWVRKYRDKAQMKKVPEMSALAKILPSGLLTVAVITLAILFAQTYKQPSRKARLWPDLPPAAATVIALIGVNVAVFMLWRLPPLWKFFNRVFLVVPAYPYSLSMLTACFSHQSLAHLLPNVILIWLIGTRLHDDIGRGPFLALYFSSAVLAAYIPMVVYVMKNFLGTSTLGASGVITALLGTSCVLHEGQKIIFPFLPPEWTRGVDTGVMLAVFIILEAMSLRKWGIVPSKLLNTGRPGVDNMGHLSGYFAGICAGAFIRSTDPKWKNVERKHFFTKDFSKI